MFYLRILMARISTVSSVATSRASPTDTIKTNSINLWFTHILARYSWNLKYIIIYKIWLLQCITIYSMYYNCMHGMFTSDYL